MAAKPPSATEGGTPNQGRGHALWGGRFRSGLAPEMEALNRSLDVDWRLWPHDVRGSRAWARALGRAGVLASAEVDRIDEGLRRVARRLGGLAGPAGLDDEDVHTAVERLLIDEIGPLGGKLHTGRSRNDQVATDLRLWGKAATDDLGRRLSALARTLLDRAGDVAGVAMPGYTHLQRAQPVPASHWLMSRAWPLVRDLDALAAVRRECDSMPLGSGALAGCPFDVDRRALADDLGFRAVSENSMDAVGDRDWVARLIFVAALAGVHLSQLSEDLVVFSSAEFGLLRVGEGFATGSSLMPQKRNPDVAELVRGKSGRLVGNLTAVLTVLKGLPAGYNRDLQEDKEALFDSVDTLAVALPALQGAVAGATLDAERAGRALGAELFATDLADYLVRKGVPFRESHGVAGALVRKAEERGLPLDALSLEEMRDAHEAFEEDVVRVFDAAASIESRAARGGSAGAAQEEQRGALAAALDRAERGFRKR